MRLGGGGILPPINESFTPFPISLGVTRIFFLPFLASCWVGIPDSAKKLKEEDDEEDSDLQAQLEAQAQCS